MSNGNGNGNDTNLPQLIGLAAAEAAKAKL